MQGIVARTHYCDINRRDEMQRGIMLNGPQSAPKLERTSNHGDIIQWDTARQSPVGTQPAQSKLGNRTLCWAHGQPK